MAPIKTYGKKKKNGLVTVETGRMKKKMLQNDRRPLATLQSANVRSVKELVHKVKQNTTPALRISVCNSNAAKSSPSFPGSEELSSIYLNKDSTFDKLLQTCQKPQPVVKEEHIKTSPSYNAIETNPSPAPETPALSSRSKKYRLRSLTLINRRRNKFGQSSSESCPGCDDKSCYSRSLNSENNMQLSSTPNVGNSIRPDITELTPIYPEILQAFILTPIETVPVSSVSPLVIENFQEDVPCEVSQPESAARQTPPKPKNSKSKACEGVYSPDMFSSCVSNSNQPQSQSDASEYLSNCDDGIHSNARVMPLETLEISVAANNSEDTASTTAAFGRTSSSESEVKVELGYDEIDVKNSSLSNVNGFQLKYLGHEKASHAIDDEISSSSNDSTDSLMSKSSMTENDFDGKSCSQPDQEMADSWKRADALTARLSVINSDCENSLFRVKVELGKDKKDVTTSSLGTVESFQQKSLEPGNTSRMVDVRASYSSTVSTDSLMSNLSETENNLDGPRYSQQDEDMADSLHKADAVIKRLSPIASDCENSVSLACDEEASPVRNYVNLRNRNVRWQDHSSLKNHSGQKSLGKIIETNSFEVGDTVGDQLETETVSGTGSESEPACQQVISEQRAPTLRPSVALGRRTSIWLSSKARAASRRFSVAPGKLLAKPRPTSLGFRGLHGTLAPTLAEQVDFFDKLDSTINNLSAVSIAPAPATHATQLDIPNQITPRDVVLQKCEQDEPLPFDDAFPEAYLSKCRKIGEGLYGEVFMWEAGLQSSVIKVIPIAGDELINGERQKTYDEILSEIIITKELSDLRHTECVADHSDDLTSGFVEVKRTACVRGKYPPRLLQLWEEFAEQSGTENDNPDVFSEDQMFIVLELANGGADLEKFQFNNSSQALSIFLQTAYALAAAERRIEFEHRDLHWGNVLVSKTDVKHLEIVMNGTLHKIPTNGVQVSIIDFTLSRMTFDGFCIYNDLSQDDSLFVSDGDYQFDIYRMMKENCRNDWREFVPANNVLWLHYLVDKMIAGVHYRKTSTKVHRENLKKLVSFKRSLLNFTSTGDFVESLS